MIVESQVFDKQDKTNPNQIGMIISKMRTTLDNILLNRSGLI